MAAAGRAVVRGLEAGAAVGDLLAHVRDVEARHLAGAVEQRGRGAGVVGVHVHAQRLVVAHDQHRVAQPLEPRHVVGALEPLARDREVGAEAVLARLVLGQVEGARGQLVRDLGRRVSAQRADHARQHHGEAVGARVHDACLAQHRQLLGAALHRLLAGLERPLEHLGQQLVLLARVGVGAEPRRVHVREVLGHAVCHRPHGAEHRALGGLAHRLVGGVGGAGEGRGHQHRVHQLAGPGDQLGRRAAHDLGQDHAAVAAGAEQRGAGHGVHDRVAADHVDRLAVHAVELVEHGAHRHRHVVPGIAVGYREDVEVVDLLTARLKLGIRSGHGAAEPDQAGIGHEGCIPRPGGRVSARAPRPPW